MGRIRGDPRKGARVEWGVGARRSCCGILPHSWACDERISLPSLPYSCLSQGKVQVRSLSQPAHGKGTSPWSNPSKLQKQEIWGMCSTLPPIRLRFHPYLLICEMR